MRKRKRRTGRKIKKWRNLEEDWRRISRSKRRDGEEEK